MKAPSDPRPPLRDEADIRPVVAGRGGQASTWLGLGGVLIGGLLLFFVLDGQRRAATAPTIKPRPADAIATLQPPPPLYVLPEPPAPSPPPPPPLPSEVPVLAAAAQPVPTPRPPIASAPLQPIPFAPQPPPPGYAPPQGFAPPQVAGPPQGAAASTSAALVIDTAAGASSRGEGDSPAAAGASRTGDGAIQSGRLRRTATTVPQGTLIPAVLETALDSSRPGNLRAIVSRDVSGFDGSRVLIPRGSRLFGEYQADLTEGQNRAFVQWTRLVRPDGVTIALASPAADLQGRTGVRGRVDTHFWQRFGSALLQTTLNIGASAAGRSLGGDAAVVVALPGATQNVGAAAAQTRLQPTLRVDAGARVTVLVARDLEFSGEARR